MYVLVYTVSCMHMHTYTVLVHMFSSYPLVPLSLSYICTVAGRVGGQAYVIIETTRLNVIGII